MDANEKEEVIYKFSSNLSKIRAEAGLSQAKLAEMIGISRQTLCAMENGKRKMSWTIFLACYLVVRNKFYVNLLMRRVYEIDTEKIDNYLQSSDIAEDNKTSPLKEYLESHSNK